MRKGTTSGLVVSMAMIIALAACGGSGSDGAADGASGASGDKATTSTTSATGPGRCGKYTAGEGGVLRTFCDGKATATVTIDGTDHEFSGGSCTESGDTLSVNIGVVTGMDFQGELPDYFGANVPVPEGEFGGEGVVLALQVDGAALTVTEVTGNRAGESASLRAVPLDGGDPITGTFTC